MTEFEDHIFVTVDAEAFFFLHDLIISYIREKNRVVCILNSCLLFSVFNSVKNEKKTPTYRLVLIPNFYLMRITIKILEYCYTCFTGFLCLCQLCFKLCISHFV